MNDLEAFNNYFTDKTSISLYGSLTGYGMIRNPKSGLTIFKQGNKFCKITVTLKDIRKKLEKTGQDFFNYIGSDRETELKKLCNNTLTGIIQSLNAYYGIFYNSSIRFNNLQELLSSLNYSLK